MTGGESKVEGSALQEKARHETIYSRFTVLLIGLGLLFMGARSTAAQASTKLRVLVTDCVTTPRGINPSGF